MHYLIKGMTGLTSPFFLEQFRDSSDKPLSGGSLTFLVAGSTSLPKDIYVDYAMTNLAPNPLPLDASGFAPQYFMESGLYKVIIKTSTGSIVATRDYIEGSAAGAVVPDDHKVMVDQYDTPEYLVDKVVSGVGTDVINVTSATRKLQIDSKGWVKTNSGDEAMGTLSDKIVTSQTVQVVTKNVGNNDYKMYFDVDVANVLDGKVKVSTGDSTAEFLQDKIVDSASVVWTTASVGGVQTISAEVDPDTVTGDHKVICSIDDSSPDYLEGKIVAGTGPVTVTTESSGQDQQIHINVFGPGDVGINGYCPTMDPASATDVSIPNLNGARCELVTIFNPRADFAIDSNTKLGCSMLQGASGILILTIRDQSYNLIAYTVTINSPTSNTLLESPIAWIQNPITFQQLSSYRLVAGTPYYFGLHYSLNGASYWSALGSQNTNILPAPAWKFENLTSLTNTLSGGSESLMRLFVRGVNN